MVVKVIRDGRVVPNISVHISWVGGGHSRGTTNENGVYSPGLSGPRTARSIQINGKEVANDYMMENGDNIFSIR